MIKNYILFLLLFTTGTFCLAQDKMGADVKLRLNNGDRYTNTQTVSLELNQPNAASMQIVQDGNFEYAKWIDYDKFIQSYELEPGDGKKDVSVRFRLKSGEVTEAYTRSITVDTAPPSDLAIEFDLEDVNYYNDPSLEVVVYLDAKGAKFMKLSNTKSFYGTKWQVYKEDVDWVLASGDDGPRFVYAKFIDAAQNESEVIFAKIIVDREGPIGGDIVVDRGAKFSIQQDKKAKIELKARGADFMMISLDPRFVEAEWQPFQPEIEEFPLGEEDGEKEVYVKYKDVAGNETKVFSNKIILDTTPPKDCMVQIDGDSDETSEINKKVMLSFSATKDTKWMLVSNQESFWGAKWRMYKPSLSWQLDGEENGEKTVYVKFRDEAGNVSKIFSDSILLNRGF